MSLAVRQQIIARTMAEYGADPRNGIGQDQIADLIDRIQEMDFGCPKQSWKVGLYGVQAVWLSHPDSKWVLPDSWGGETLLVHSLTPCAGGTFKDGFEGVLGTTAEKVLRVFLLITKPHPAKSVDWNKNEFDINSNALKDPIPGCVPILAVRPNTPVPEASFQFSSLSPLKGENLYSIVSRDDFQETFSRTTRNKLQLAILQSGVQLHGTGRIHRDIKPENILVKINLPEGRIHSPLQGHKELYPEETEFDLALCDLGYAANVNAKEFPKTVPGSPLWAPPEVGKYCIDKKNSPNSIFTPAQAGDVWSLGLILLAIEDFDIFKAVCPSDRMDKPFILLQTLNGFYVKNLISVFPEPEDRASRLHIIWEMMRPRPENRITLKEALDLFNKSSS